MTLRWSRPRVTGLTVVEFEAAIFTRPEERKATQNLSNGVVWDSYESFKVIANGTIRQITYDFLLASITMPLSCTVSKIQRDTGRKSLVFDTCIWEDPLEFHQMLLRQKTSL